MTLREFIANNIGKKVKIGFKDGSSFIFCGVLTEDIYTLLENATERSAYGRVTKKNNTIPTINREIKEKYPSVYGGEIILIDGTGVGSYWTYEEYEAKNAVPEDMIKT